MGQWKFDGVDLDSFAYNIEVIPLDTKAPALNTAEGEERSVYTPNKPSKHLRTRNLLLLLWIKGTGSSLEVSDYTRVKGKEMLEKLFHTKGVHTLEQTLSNGSVRFLTCEVSDISSFGSLANKILIFTANLICFDPFWYNSIKAIWSADITVTPFISTIVNLNRIPSCNVKITLTGEISNPKIENLTNQNWVKLNATMGSSDTVVMDCALQTAKYNAMNNHKLVAGNNSSWFAVCPEVNIIRITSQTPPLAHLKIEYDTLRSP